MTAALSIFQPSDEQGKAKAKPKPSAASLLSAAKKPAKGSSSHMTYTGDPGREVAARWLALNAKVAETERELGLARDQLIEIIRPWHSAACAHRRQHESTVVVDSPAGGVRVSFQHRYARIPLDQEVHLQALVAAEYKRFFRRTCSLKVRKEIADDPATLDAIVEALGEALGADKFALVFEVDQSLIPTKAYTETSCQLPAETRAGLSLAGVRQIVAVAPSK